MSDKLNITEYNLLDYSLKLQEAVEKGYRISDSVNDSPMKIGNAYTATLSFVEKEPTITGELAVKVSVDTTELQEQLKQGGDIEQALEASLVIEEDVVEEQLELPLEVIPFESKTPNKRGRK